ncbi:hypothetical protein N7U66_04315 [Lacinutrix neustonica]|uniref:DUF6705 domain-containing protein n=1 Tax=Lacinutrix neustonica TaxID=2980107 RepID=A0A9E8MZ12_9FLAO|nr:DUF6705 family protein [Lacinutrix neustonica]WAC02864.1 hypothetical protein N7U66_04315 [Lacinutrix neustonica]
MKTIKLLILLTIALFSIQCKSQQLIVNLEDHDGSAIVHSYYKDSNNLLTPFVGIWVFEDGTTYFKLILEKKTMVNAGDHFEDLLIGEYQYKENGVELVNTLNKLTDTLPNEYHHSIDGNYVNTRHSPFYDFTTDTFWIDLTMSEPNGRSSSLGLRKTTVNGQSAIQVFKRGNMLVLAPGDPEPAPSVIPNGFYYLLAQ